MKKKIIWSILTSLCAFVSVCCFVPKKIQKLRELHRIIKTEKGDWISFLSDEDIERLDKNAEEILFIIGNSDVSEMYVSTTLDEVEKIINKIPKDKRGTKINAAINSLR